jgi:hypothetical protein
VLEERIDTRTQGKHSFEIIEALESVRRWLPDKYVLDLGGVEFLTPRNDAIAGHRFTESLRPARLVDAGQMQQKGH